jgi:hypothetical protein
MRRHHPQLRIRVAIHHTHLRRPNPVIDPRLVRISPPVALVAIIIASRRLLTAEPAVVECIDWIAND